MIPEARALKIRLTSQHRIDFSCGPDLSTVFSGFVSAWPCSVVSLSTDLSTICSGLFLAGCVQFVSASNDLFTDLKRHM